jgi:hypothetical protein
MAASQIPSPTPGSSLPPVPALGSQELTTAAAARSLKPTEREALARQEHIATLERHIEDQKTHTAEAKAETERLREELAAERSRAEVLAIRAERLEVGGCASALLSLLGTLVSLGGGGSLGYAGAAPNLTDVEKAHWVGGGIAALVIGGVFLIAGQVFAFWVKPKPSKS